MMLKGETDEHGENPIPMPLCPSQIPHGLARAPTRVSGVKGRRHRLCHSATRVCS
jgi:hypothetical protein